MKRAPAFLLTALLAATLLLSACTGSDAVDQNANGTYKFNGATALGKLYPANDRKPAGSFSGPLLSGGTFHSAQAKGKVLVVNFWGSWCGPCRIETPQFDLLYRKVKTQGVDFVGIDSREPAYKGRTFVRDYDISYPSIHDEPGETALRLGNLPTANFPFTVVIDRKGRVAAVYIARLSYNDLNQSLTKLLAER
jgi:thiol-disulfide isomerase/thioredoxin